MEAGKLALMGHPNFSDNADSIEYLSRGAFGDVFKAHDVRLGEVAVKLVASTYVSKNLRHFLAEVFNHRQLCGHAHIIEFKYVFALRDFVGIVMEFASKKNLTEFVQKTLPRVKDREALVRWYFQQLMLAVDYCHGHEIVNRDMKLDNTLLSTAPSMRSQFPLLKICDFGFSKAADISSPKTLGLGTYPYMAPELLMLLDSATAIQHYEYDGKAVDVWSCGVILYLLMFGDFPFGRFNGANVEKRQAAIKLMLDGTYIRKLPNMSPSAGCIDLLQKMLNPHPEQRITVGDILKHEWFQQGLTAAHMQYNKKVLSSRERNQKKRQPADAILKEMAKVVDSKCLQEALANENIAKLIAT